MVQYPSGVSQRTWSPSASEVITASLLRQNVTAPLWLVTSPTMVILAQQQSAGTFGSGSYGTVGPIDTEIVDTGGGHSDVTSPGRYYVTISGWWLLRGTIPFAGAATNSQFSFGAGFLASHSGTSTAYHGGRHGGAASATAVVMPAACELLPLNSASPVTSGDWFQLQGFQDTGGTINLGVNVGVGVFTWFGGRWCGVQGGTAGLSVPSPASFADNTQITGAFMNSNVRDTVNFLAFPPMARLANSGGTQTVATGTDTAVTMQTATVTTVNSDNYSGWSSGTNPTRYTVQRAGRYWVYGQVAFAHATGGIWSAGLRVNGTGTVWRSTRVTPPSTSTQGMILPIEMYLRLNAGDYVELIAAQSSGGTVSLATGGSDYSKLMLLWRGS